MSRKAIPTVYKGIEFRSRLEAKWAIMFDLLDWPWEYEPIDLEGYIPDFVLPFAHGSVLVEVKPAMTEEELRKAIPKIIASGWEGEALVVGARLLELQNCIGIMNDRQWLYYEEDDDTKLIPQTPEDWELALLFRCREHQKIGFCNSIHSYMCRVCGAHDGDHHMNGHAFPDVSDAWSIATNATKYRHKQR